MRADQPLYRDLAAVLRRRIRDGDFAVGEKIPTEAELGLAQGVSRNTVRQAVEQLVAEGVLDRQQGRGTFVRGLPQLEPGLAREPAASPWVFRLVDAGSAPATIELANLFGLAPDAAVFSMIRLQLEEGRPAAIKRYHAPDDLFRDDPPGPEERAASPFDAILLKRGVRLLRMNLMVRPMTLETADAALLETPPGGLTLFTQRIGFNEHGRAVRLSETLLSPERARLFWSMRRPYGESGRAEAVNIATWTAAAFD